MYRKKQRSRLNSYSSLRDFCYSAADTMRDFRECMEGSIPDIEQCSHGGTMPRAQSCHNSECDGKLSRTELLIKDYLEFKAARCIQRFVRGWLVRIFIAKQIRAAIIIQTEWRRFYCQRLYFRKLEKLIQQHIEEHYFRAAQKIQAIYRGWWSRQNVHDHARLTRLSTWAGEDLLHCVAFKLHHLIRTYAIPGVYSLKNKTTLSKVEQLLASLSYKQCNDHSQEGNRQRIHQISSAKKHFEGSKFATQIPYAGLDMYNLCAQKYQTLFSEKDADRKMAKILQMYALAHREDPRVIKIRHGKSTGASLVCLPPPTTFCGDIIRSMKRWKIIKESNLTVDKNILERPQNVENFLKEIHWKWNKLQGNCHCEQAFIKELEKGNKFTGSCPPVLN
ncbi:hypothetical protein GQX74_013608 [Glossina fuscipes]|nr:hypothetical protein GQX74_013608 [Glossina fuscipes]